MDRVLLLTTLLQHRWWWWCQRLFIIISIFVVVQASTIIDNTRPKYDVAGNIINAHDGTIQKFGDYWYYHGAEYGLCKEPVKYGCDHTPNDNCGFHNNHNVSIYRRYQTLSNDGWERVGTAVQCTQLEGCAILYRPHLVYNPLTKKYVLFVNSVGREHTYNGNAVYSANHPEGPFQLETTKMNLTRLCPGPFAPSKPCGAAQGGCGDFDVLVDPIDHQAYIVYGCNFYISIEKLTPDYYNTAPLPSGGRNGNATVDGGKFNGTVFPDYFVEAPAMFERNGIYYLLYGRCCCFCEQGSGVLVYVAKHPMGPWRRQPGGDLACVPPPPAASSPHHLFQNNNNNNNINGIPTPNQGCSYNGSKEISITKAQQNFIIRVGGKNNNKSNGTTTTTTTYVWTGDLWQQSPDGLKGHEGQYWYPLQFDSKSYIKPLKYVDSFILEDNEEEEGSSLILLPT